MHELQTEMEKNKVVPQQLGAFSSQCSALCRLQLQICTDKMQARHNALMDRVENAKDFIKHL